MTVYALTRPIIVYNCYCGWTIPYCGPKSTHLHSHQEAGAFLFLFQHQIILSLGQRKGWLYGTCYYKSHLPGLGQGDHRPSGGWKHQKSAPCYLSLACVGGVKNLSCRSTQPTESRTSSWTGLWQKIDP